jgi:hypothetical protein
MDRFLSKVLAPRPRAWTVIRSGGLLWELRPALSVDLVSGVLLPVFHRRVRGQDTPGLRYLERYRFEFPVVRQLVSVDQPAFQPTAVQFAFENIMLPSRRVANREIGFKRHRARRRVMPLGDRGTGPLILWRLGRSPRLSTMKAFLRRARVGTGPSGTLIGNGWHRQSTATSIVALAF